MSRTLNTTVSEISSFKHICFFGIGAALADCYHQLVLVLGREPDFLCDNAEAKWGQPFFGIPCISPSELLAKANTTAVIIAVRRYEAIHSQLTEMGCKTIFVACFDRAYDVVSRIKPLLAYQQDGKQDLSSRSVNGKWTLVTGASRGIGRQIAQEMAKLGSHLIVHSRNAEHTIEVARSCAAFGVEVRHVSADLGDERALEQMLDDLLNDYPPVDIVFNNAAISLQCGDDPFYASSSDYLKHYAVNTIAPIRICYRLIPSMITRGFGRIVNVSSTIQKRALEMPYACSKAALNKFVHDLAPSLEGSGVMMSLACPGYVRSDMGGESAPHSVESVIPGVLLGALLDADVNGRWFIAQDFAGLDLAQAIRKAEFYLSLKED